MSESRNKLRVGVVGLRGIGNQHAEVYRSHELSDLVAVCDLDHARADAAAQRWDAKPYYSVREMLDHAGLDCVSVATGGFELGSLHYEPVIECLTAGKHVLCEKP